MVYNIFKTNAQKIQPAARFTEKKSTNTLVGRKIRKTKENEFCTVRKKILQKNLKFKYLTILSEKKSTK